MAGRRRRRLADDEYVVTAWAEPAAGPGWANSPVLVLVRKRGTDEMRLEYLQPEEQDDAMRVLYRVSADMAETMRAHAALLLEVRRGR